MPTNNETHPLGVSVYCLRNTLLQDVQNAGLDKSATVYDIEDLRQKEKEKFGVIRRKGASAICPRDNEIGAAYVDCLEGVDNVGPANRMLSYVWGYTIGDIIDSLETYCHQTGNNTKRTYIWICCLCNNQHRFQDEVPFNTLYENFRGKVVGVGHILAMMAPWNEPLYLTRVWCIFEMHTANSAGDVEVEIIMPPKERDNMLEGLRTYDNLVKALMGTQIEKAEASVASDKENIMELVNNTAGGGSALNNNVNTLLRSCYKNMMLAAVDNYSVLNNDDISSDLKFARLCYDVGRVMKETNDYDKAIELYEKALAVREEVLGKEHTSTAATYNNIAMVMKKQGDLDEALKMHHKCLAVKEKVLGEEHTSTANTYNNIAMVMKQQGDIDGALKMYHKCLVVREKVLGEEHTSTATTYGTIASAMKEKGDIDGALKMYHKCLAVEEKVLGEEHTSTSITYWNVGRILQDKGDIDAALEMFHKTLTAEEKVYGKGHKETLQTKRTIGRISWQVN
eukprot:CAMPEP_0198275746 /NCGR_PEP_ID=MMETSP1447-20131203/64940_1 /TAXON_ID=420782 /ORGANISM="Chaetoceros dichaeta, Strain CCMP1751" /LENGTH=509 /DNA_ID=CAMNT_0043970641 /DNA_START=48 /DNA_END=1577 /DNA_ORIENTATION=-